MSNINWNKSYLLTAEQVALLGLTEKSVAELGKTSQSIPDLARLADAMGSLTVDDLSRWKDEA